MSGTHTLPNLIFDDPYFNEKRPFSRREAAAWIAKHVRWTDNCVLRRGQGSWSIRYLAEAWGWTKDKVIRFLKKLESLSVIRVARESISATAQTVITYLFSTAYKADEDSSETAARQQRDSSATKTNSGNTGKEEDSCPPQASDEPEEDLFEEAMKQAAGAGTSEIPPEPAKTAPDGAGPPKNSAKKVPARSPEFMAAWDAMPKMARKRSSMELAEKQWRKLSQQQRADAVRGIRLWEDDQFAKAADRWLRDHLWEGLLDAEGDTKQSDYSREMDELYA